MKSPFKAKGAPASGDAAMVNARGKLVTRLRRNRDYYLMMLPALIYVLMFCYAPMYGLQIAFKNYKMSLGVAGSPWIGFRNFTDFFNSYYFGTLIRNTLTLSLYNLAVGFPIPIIIALILNELTGKFKKFTQTILYAPHFISLVVLVSTLNCMLSPSQGVVNTILEMLGFERNYFMANPAYFPHLYVWSGVWQGMGWSAIIYLAALSGVDPTLYEAADMDGATRLQKIIHINLPALMPTIIIILIMSVGKIASVGYEKVYLMQNDLNIETAEVISTYVYKRGLINSNYSFAAAVDLFNNVINVTLVLIANKISKMISDTSLF